MCPLLCVHCECLAVVHTSFVVFHPLTSYSKYRHLRYFKTLARNYPTRAWRAQKTSVGYRKIYNPPEHPALGRAGGTTYSKSLWIHEDAELGEANVKVGDFVPPLVSSSGGIHRNIRRTWQYLILLWKRHDAKNNKQRQCFSMLPSTRATWERVSPGEQKSDD